MHDHDPTANPMDTVEVLEIFTDVQFSRIKEWAMDTFSDEDIFAISIHALVFFFAYVEKYGGDLSLNSAELVCSEAMLDEICTGIGDVDEEKKNNIKVFFEMLMRHFKARYLLRVDLSNIFSQS